jgi:hypothetical protein
MHVFLSRPNWIADEFQEGLDVFLTQLNNLGLDPRTLGVSDYPSRAPLDEVIAILNECKGAIVLGVPQLEIQTGYLKGIPLKQPLTLATEWNHIEAALAYAKGLPVLILNHQTVTRGIFDRGVLNAFVHSVNLGSNAWSMQPAINGAIKQWKESCTKGSGNLQKSTNTKLKSDEPKCPNCSTSSISTYLSPIGKPFQHLAGGNWECTSCNYVE